MPCACNGTLPSTPEQKFEVIFPNGTRKVVEGEHNAKVEITKAGGGTYSRV